MGVFLAGAYWAPGCVSASRIGAARGGEAWVALHCYVSRWRRETHNQGVAKARLTGTDGIVIDNIAGRVSAATIGARVDASLVDAAQ